MYSIDQTFNSLSDVWVDAAKERMPVFIVMRGSQLGRRYLLNENALILGRNPQRSDLVIADDPEISSRHCVIEFAPVSHAYMVRDLHSTNGTWVNGLRVDSTRLYDGDKLMIGRTILKFTFQDVIEAEYHQQVDRMMNLDELTGLVVQRVFNDRFRLALSECLAKGQPISVLMMDLDNLKLINDRHGHHAGAQTIATVGQLLAELMPTGGLASRFGGDEYSAFAVGLDRPAGLELAEQIREAVEDRCRNLDRDRIGATISIGLSTHPDDGPTLEQLTRRADEALYRAKAAGRNCVRT